MSLANLQPSSVKIFRRRDSPKTIRTRQRASTSMYSLTFCIRFLLRECHQRKPAVQAAAVMLRTPPSTANHRRANHAHFPYTAHNFENAPVTRQSAASSARRPRPAGHSHYVVISRDGRKIVTRVRVMLSQQHNPCPDCKSAQLCTTRGQPLLCPQVTSGSVQWCPRTAADRQTDRQTDTQTRVTTIHFASSTTHAKCNDTMTTKIKMNKSNHFYCLNFLVHHSIQKTINSLLVDKRSSILIHNSSH